MATAKKVAVKKSTFAQAMANGAKAREYRDEADALRRDAERYRWLRARLQGSGLDQLDAMDAVLREDGAQMDAAIDEEIEADRLAAVGAA